MRTKYVYHLHIKLKLAIHYDPVSTASVSLSALAAPSACAAAMAACRVNTMALMFLKGLGFRAISPTMLESCYSVKLDCGRFVTSKFEKCKHRDARSITGSSLLGKMLVGGVTVSVTVRACFQSPSGSTYPDTSRKALSCSDSLVFASRRSLLRSDPLSAVEALYKSGGTFRQAMGYCSKGLGHKLLKVPGCYTIHSYNGQAHEPMITTP